MVVLSFICGYHCLGVRRSSFDLLADITSRAGAFVVTPADFNGEG